MATWVGINEFWLKFFPQKLKSEALLYSQSDDFRLKGIDF
jgi:hypothetical protein